MTDQPFLTWAHALPTSGATRTVVERGADVFNVKDYYHTADSTDWQPAIQRAVDAASINGGTVFFPIGDYNVTNRIVVSSNKWIQLRGCGGSYDTAGSRIIMNKRDYVIYCTHGNVGGSGVGVASISLIQGLTIKNDYSGTAPTSTEPPNSPDIVTTVTGCSSGTGGNVRLAVASLLLGNFTTGQSVVVAGVTGASGANGTWTISATGATWIEIPNAFSGSGASGGTVAYNGDGCGCVYMGQTTGAAVRDCQLQLTTGIAYFYSGFSGAFENFIIGGGYTAGSDLNGSIGIFTRGCYIRNGKIGGPATGIVLIAGPSIVEQLDIELCGVGILTGYAPIKYWDSNTDQGNMVAAGNNACVPGLQLRLLNFENAGDTFIWAKLFFGTINDVFLQSFGQSGQNANYGLRIEGAIASQFFRIATTGTFSTAAIDASGADACSFTYCTANTNAGQVPWILPTNKTLRFERNSANSAYFDGAITFANLPKTMCFGDTMMCSDSTDLPYTGGASNVGKIITGGGTHKVMARFTEMGRLAATASWTNSTPNITMTSNPGFASAGMAVYDVTRDGGSATGTGGSPIGIVSTFVGTALVLTGNASYASIGSTDTLAFGAWCIAS